MQQLNVEQPPCFIHVTGTQRDKYIEFEFSIGDPELAVEMIRHLSAEPPSGAGQVRGPRSRRRL
ncbi:TPA: phenol hydroxylase subunit [Acinetobacter baumannii]|uniref:phenol hydroxylase subunit n=1 Tax=Acinetobacter baumannii TaxID=470 RepID=UPI001CB7F647|nr:phenol hydroxylase subunit [Acinetobacter baumannii]